MTIDEARDWFKALSAFPNLTGGWAALTLALLDEHEYVTTVDDEGYRRWETVERLLEEL